MKRHEKYIETTDFPGNTHLEVSVYYNKGGISYLSGENIVRGYYLSVTPVKKGDGLVSTVLFSGIKKLISPANRYSEKQHNIAIAKSAAHEQELIDYLKSKQKSA